MCADSGFYLEALDERKCPIVIFFAQKANLQMCALCAHTQYVHCLCTCAAQQASLSFVWVHTCTSFCLAAHACHIWVASSIALAFFCNIFFFFLRTVLLASEPRAITSRQAGKDRSDIAVSTASTLRALGSSIWDMTAKATCLRSWKGHGFCWAVMCESGAQWLKKKRRWKKKTDKDQTHSPPF